MDPYRYYNPHEYHRSKSEEHHHSHHPHHRHSEEGSHHQDGSQHRHQYQQQFYPDSDSAHLYHHSSSSHYPPVPPQFGPFAHPQSSVRPEHHFGSLDASVYPPPHPPQDVPPPYSHPSYPPAYPSPYPAPYPPQEYQYPPPYAAPYPKPQENVHPSVSGHPTLFPQDYVQPSVPEHKSHHQEDTRPSSVPEHHATSPPPVHLPEVELPKGDSRPPEVELPKGQLVRIFCKANRNVNLAVQGDRVMMVLANTHDEAQQWIRDDKCGIRIRDSFGQPAFILVNKACKRVLKHAKDEGKQVVPVNYDPDMQDDDVLWTESQDFGEGFKTIRMASDTLLNMTVLHGDSKRGGVMHGSSLGLDTWHKKDNQLWKIFPL